MTQPPHTPSLKPCPSYKCPVCDTANGACCSAIDGNKRADPRQAAIKALREALLDAQYDHDEMGDRYCKGCSGDKEHSTDCWIQEALKLSEGM